ncbi:MAG: O-antigen ligase family protein [Crocinitomicaceae bacterium]|nr:O-antigen ligase family protein [Crocinitomicaceae bacterium]MDG1776481.1 O-antigen ligase family protein [Crocinitomicaceae bacterium]
MIYFLPLKFNKQRFVWFAVACLMLFLCQSRTAIVAILFLFIITFIFKLSENWKRYRIIILSVTGIYLISWAITTDFFTFQSYSNNVVSNSLMGRIDTWKYLGKMIMDKPIFGYGVNKEFFYSNRLYSENEYILMTWRYGFVGLILYLLIFLIPLRHYIINRKTVEIQKSGILIIGIIMITALTNNPFQERTIMLLIALVFGLIWPFTNNNMNSNGAKD